jgi:hypothetical protein
MRSFPRFITALFLTAIYVVITMSPAMRFTGIAHAITGEYAGDCNICGCSPKQQVAHTCCCWKKKQQHDHEPQHVADCCKIKQRGKSVLSCGCPCGGNKQLAFWNGENYDQLPYRFNEGMQVLHEDDLSSFYNRRLTDRNDDPPDPPPER